MKESASYVVVFPDVFSRKKMKQLADNIKAILKIKGERFESVVRDDDVILVHANDPVFASSAIGLLFGVRRIAIAKRTDNGFDELVSKIVSVGGNLILRGERFLVRVEGTTKGFIAKDAEIAATSKIIERAELGAVPGTDQRFDKEIYTYITRKNAYVCIFSDGAMGGTPLTPQQDKTVCPVYDELSALSCFECMRQGYDVNVMIFYRRRSELLNLARLVNRLIPRMLRDEIELEFIRMTGKFSGKSSGKAYLAYVNAITETVLDCNIARVALAVPPVMFPAKVVDAHLARVFRRDAIPVVPLAGTGMDGMYEIAREMGFGEAGVGRLEKQIAMATASPTITNTTTGNTSLQETDTDDGNNKFQPEKGQKITVTIGANNVHDILDALYPEQQRSQFKRE